ncbi:SixA phosphatase family protein [Phyllobacterium sp. P5_D12]
MGVKAIRLLVGLAAGILVFCQSGNAQEVIYIVRHSDPPSTLNLDEILDETPPESGQQRAKMLAERLKDAGISAVYATQARRTVETSEPLAKARGLEIRVHSYEDSDGLVRLLRSDNGKDRVLIVGHWSTIPEILKALGYPEEVKIERSAYDNLFVVVPGGTKLRLSCTFITETEVESVKGSSERPRVWCSSDVHCRSEIAKGLGLESPSRGKICRWRQG